MSEPKRARFQTSAVSSNENQAQDDEDERFIIHLNSMLRVKKSTPARIEEAIPPPDEDDDVVMKSEVKVSRIVQSMGTEYSPNQGVIQRFQPADYNDTFFPFSRDFRFADDGNGYTPSLYDYLVNVNPAIKYEPAKLPDETEQAQYAEFQGNRFYAKVPWVQIYNPNAIVPFRGKRAIPTYDMNWPYFKRLGTEQKDSGLGLESLTEPVLFESKNLDFRRTVVFTDVLSLFLILLSKSEDQVIINAISDYCGIVKSVYGSENVLVNQEMSFTTGGVMSFLSIKKEDDADAALTIAGAVDKYLTGLNITGCQRLLQYMLFSGLTIADYDTRVGLVAGPQYDSEIDQRLAQIDAYIKTFRSLAGIADAGDAAYYQEFMKGFDDFLDKYLENDTAQPRTSRDILKMLEDFKITPGSTIAAFADFGARVVKKAARLLGSNTQDVTIQQVLKEIKAEIAQLNTLSKDLMLATKPYNMEIAKFGTDIRSLLIEMRKIYVTQKEEIKMWKDMYDKLKKDKAIQSSSVVKPTALKSADLSIGARNYLNLLIREFLMKNPLMKLIYNVCGTAQLKDISNYLNLNIAGYLLEELCETQPGIKKNWQDYMDLRIDNFGTKPATNRLMSFFVDQDDNKDKLMMSTAQYLLSAPVYKAFMETFQYVELLHRKTSPPMTLSVLVSEDFKGVSLEMATMVAAIMTKEQDIQKQHATTRFDKPGINVNLSHARLSIRKKMEIHLGCNFEGIPRIELII